MFKVIILLGLIAIVHGKSVIVGQTFDNGVTRKVYEKVLERNAIPLFKRDDEVTFEYAGEQKIKGIAIKDLENGLAEPSITRGGIGFSDVHIRVESERGSGYKFLVEIFG